MLLDLLAAAADTRLPFALEIFERTASTPRVQQVVQLSLAPAFLLSGIGAIMNVIMSRMIWIAKRIETIDDKLEEERTARQLREHGWLMRRRRLMQGAIMFSTASAVMISAVIMLLFVAAYITAQIGTVIAFLWVLTMALLVTGLGFFLLETRLAALGALEAKE
jgi:MFS family permease